MPRSISPRPITAILAAFVAVLLGSLVSPAPAEAHNTFESSTPAEGAVLLEPPTQISMVFANAVPLDTASAEVVDASGARTELTGLTNGPAGETELIAPLPAIAAGEVTVRWRLVGPDGHPLTGRVTFSISGPATTVPAAAATTVPAAASTTVAASLVDAGAAAGDSRGFSTPSVLRWLLRYGSYLAIMLVLGVVLTDGFVWPGCASRPSLRRVVDRALAAVALLGAIQALILASDISGDAPWSSFGSLDIAVRTDAGLALSLRALIAGCTWIVLRRMDLRQVDVRWTAVGVSGIALMGTWAFAGHSASQRWPELGVPLDVVHHVAAATWVGALAIVALVAARTANPEELSEILRRLARTAATAVTVVIATGIIQGVRLVGSPLRLFDGTHGRLLVLKILVLSAMLLAANANRQRVARNARSAGAMATRTLIEVRQMVVVELTLGVLILAITSAMVVSPPASAASMDSAPSSLLTTPELHDWSR